ncbi:MAG TPA: hypothetical protein VK557_06135 [Pyrinomonadaceae bacterium]|nr:hypothetical protein [Pyrinomonadaceae bacterium]
MKAQTSTLAVLLLLVLPACPLAQNKDAKLPQPQEEREDLKGFRAEGGLVNVVEGEVVYLKQKKTSQTLKPQQELETGDEIQVGQNSYAEFLLNPGSYLRLSPRTRVRFLDLTPDNLKLKLLSGSVILETSITRPRPESFTKPNQKQSTEDVRDRFAGQYSSITVLTAQGDFVTAAGGLYRCDVDDDGRGSLKVLNGIAVVPGSLLSDGMRTALGDRVPVIESFDTAREDSFDAWSHRRAISLLDSNRSLRNTAWHTRLRKNHLSYLNIEYDERLDRMKQAMTVSVNPGTVAFAELGAEYQTEGSPWKPLAADAELKDGDRVRTGPDARVEIHIYPECYLLLSANAEIAYNTRRDQGVAAKLIQGSAIIVSTLPGSTGLVTSLIAPEGEIEIPTAGFYRLDVHPHRPSDLLVYQGSVTIRGRELTEGKRAVLSQNDFDSAVIRQMDIDPFEMWSRYRSSLLMQVLIRARRSGFVPAKELTKYEVDIFKHRKAPPAAAHNISSAGMWYLDPAAKAYTFVPGVWAFSPFGGDYLSPYGGEYAVSYRLHL